ncbi:MAG: hypothetical protein H0U72_03430 [Nitrosospira sp.]|nr:hypothetical protein [Nitrosospira sp.]
MNNENTSDGADEALHRFDQAVTGIEGKEEIEDDDILRLTSLLSDYAKHPGSTEHGRINASEELDRIRAMYLSKNKP